MGWMQLEDFIFFKLISNYKFNARWVIVYHGKLGIVPCLCDSLDQGMQKVTEIRVLF